MKLKDIIKMFDPLSAIIIYETGEEDEVWSGSVLDIPWYYLDYYIIDSEGCIISTQLLNSRPAFAIEVQEQKPEKYVNFQSLGF
jgi:hypothetical protein